MAVTVFLLCFERLAFFLFSSTRFRRVFAYSIYGNLFTSWIHIVVLFGIYRHQIGWCCFMKHSYIGHRKCQTKSGQIICIHFKGDIFPVSPFAVVWYMVLITYRSDFVYLHLIYVSLISVTDSCIISCGVQRAEKFCFYSMCRTVHNWQ